MKGGPGKLAREFMARRRKLDAALFRGLRNWAIAVDRAQVDNLRGGNQPGDYPVPVRTGNLLGSHFFAVPAKRRAVVGNTASYAVPIHEGQGGNAVHGRRPFLEDAAKATDGAAIVQKPLRKVFA